MMYELEITQRAGVKLLATDVLSRLPTDGADDSALEDNIPP